MSDTKKKTLFSYFSTNKKICLENYEVSIKINKVINYNYKLSFVFILLIFLGIYALFDCTMLLLISTSF
jgi:hypothetical protein